MELKEKLVALRKEKGLTQSAVAEKLDVSRQAISRWESGVALPSTDNLKSLSALYGVPVDYLLNSDTEEQRVTKGLEAENIPMNGKRTKRNLWVVLSIVMIVLLLVACEIFLYVNKRDEQNRRKEQPTNKANGNQKSLGRLKGAKTVAR